MDLVKPTLALFAITLCAAILIGVTYNITQEPIAQQRARTETEAIIAFFPDTYTTEHFKIYDSSSLTGYHVSRGVNGEIVGYVFSAAPAGYGGTVYMMVALDLSGALKGVQIISHSETPGLGSVIAEDWFAGQFIGLTERVSFGEIDTVASATISINAVLRGVNDAIEFFEGE
ncbi:MAG: FMN-binding protein [Defluviitaleaceae bacterium]|nr:FMN-binding protein [Defluviitaleaceae bacterium]